MDGTGKSYAGGGVFLVPESAPRRAAGFSEGPESEIRFQVDDQNRLRYAAPACEFRSLELVLSYLILSCLEKWCAWEVRLNFSIAKEELGEKRLLLHLVGRLL